jgi:hypothetical protein
MCALASKLMRNLKQLATELGIAVLASLGAFRRNPAQRAVECS